MSYSKPSKTKLKLLAKIVNSFNYLCKMVRQHGSACLTRFGVLLWVSSVSSKLDIKDSLLAKSLASKISVQNRQIFTKDMNIHGRSQKCFLKNKHKQVILKKIMNKKSLFGKLGLLLISVDFISKTSPTMVRVSDIFSKRCEITHLLEV